MNRIRLMLIDDHALFLKGLAGLLEREPDFEVAGCYGLPSEALLQFDTCRPDLVLLDYNLGSERALEFVRTLRQRSWRGGVLIVTAGIDGGEAIQLVEAGVAGIFHKHQAPELLMDVVRRVAGGDAWLEQQYVKSLFTRVDTSTPRLPELSLRDRRIIRFVLEGLANKEIADRLSMSESGVKANLRQLFQRLGVHTRSQLVRVALERYRDQLNE